MCMSVPKLRGNCVVVGSRVGVGADVSPHMAQAVGGVYVEEQVAAVQVGECDSGGTPLRTTEGLGNVQDIISRLQTLGLAAAASRLLGIGRRGGRNRWWGRNDGSGRGGRSSGRSCGGQCGRCGGIRSVELPLELLKATL